MSNINNEIIDKIKLMNSIDGRNHQHTNLSLSLSVYQEIMGRHLIAWSNRKSSEGSTPETIGRVGKSVAG